MTRQLFTGPLSYNSTQKVHGFGLEFPSLEDRQMWSSSYAFIGATLAFDICLFTVPFLCTKRKSSLIIHFLFNDPDVRTPDSLLIQQARERSCTTKRTPELHYEKCDLHNWSPVKHAVLCTLDIPVAESDTNSAITSAPWKVTINNAYFICICICIFLPPGRAFQPSGL